MNRTRIKQTFADYTNKYNASDLKIRLKIDHTYRVAALAERIARTVTDIPIDRDLAWTMGMLHDIGRFEQVKRYGTFVLVLPSVLSMHGYCFRAWRLSAFV